jgi:hypothetical protein
MILTLADVYCSSTDGLDTTSSSHIDAMTDWLTGRSFLLRLHCFVVFVVVIIDRYQHAQLTTIHSFTGCICLCVSRSTCHWSLSSSIFNCSTLQPIQLISVVQLIDLVQLSTEQCANKIRPSRFSNERRKRARRHHLYTIDFIYLLLFTDLTGSRFRSMNKKKIGNVSMTFTSPVNANLLVRDANDEEQSAFDNSTVK